MESIEHLFSKVKLLISDVDGVMTSGAIHVFPGHEEVKTFHAQDGFGIRLLLTNQIPIAVITSRSSEALAVRMKYLGVEHVFQGAKDKRPVLDALLETLNMTLDDVAYVGDDWPDLPVMRCVGLPIAVANAVPEVKASARYITEQAGGDGAIREVAIKILKAQNLYEKALAKFLG